MTPQPKLRTRNLCKHFGEGMTQVEALRDVSIDVRDGEFISVVGASGCGKTTLLRLIDGLITPSSGSVIIDGNTVSHTGEKIAFVFQQDGLLPWRNVIKNTVFGSEIRHQNRRARLELARRFLKLTGLSGFDKSYPRHLSNLDRRFLLRKDAPPRRAAGH